MTFKRLCVFCGSNPGRHADYAVAAQLVGRTLAERGVGLVYGGGGIGLMGIAAQGAIEAGGEVIGVIPKALFEREVAMPGLVDLRVVHNMHERKALMADLSDGFLALPGGLGTFEELFEVLTWGQLGFHNKPAGVLNVRDYYTGIQAQLDHSVAEGFLHPAHRAAILVDSDLPTLLERMQRFEPANLDKWWINGDDVR
ncbi:MAG: TIGR00730 family Rossman fold protein [Fimbriimonadaceae bacterium]|nr:TIGR00730 family Rossman fold protein [Fimbriimonadaceae bacterium]